MALDGLLVLTCAVLAAAPAQVPSNSGSDRNGGVANTLAVQTAMQKGRDLLLQGDAATAVRVLEAQLRRINGNREYLVLLRAAYRAYVKDLYLQNQGALARKYLERLSILDPAAAQDASLCTGTAARPTATKGGQGAAGPAPKSPTFRGKGADDPFDPVHENKTARAAVPLVQPTLPPGGDLKKTPNPVQKEENPATALLARADQEFRRRRFGPARLLYEQAERAGAKVGEGGRGQWGYCILHQVVKQLNQADAARIPWAELERDVRRAVAMAPRLEKTGAWLLREIADRRRGRAAGAAPENESQSVKVQHHPRSVQGWYVAETANFRILHREARTVVEKVARVAEQTRAAMQRKWFGQAGPDWQPKCDIYLHADARQYSRLTGVSASSPGHSRIESDGGRVLTRRIDVHCDNAGMLVAVLPHETTHVVLAGQFGRHQVPRWADEGMAVLTEPSDKVEMHRKNLERSRRDGQLFDVRELMKLEEYPQARRIGAFYAQSVSLVDFLTRECGTVVFSRFLKDALSEGYEPALRKHYKYRDFRDLQDRWTRHAFGDKETYAAGKKSYR
jgi:hypothetical protein